jgi:hypothetical protein
MPYKTITLGLLEQYPELYNTLGKDGKLLKSLEHYARTLKSRHHYWMDQLDQVRPASDQRQISSAALELAVEDLRQTLSADSPTAEDASELSLDEAMDSLRRLTPPA